MSYTDPHWESSALVTVDVHRCTLDGGDLEIAGTTRALGRMVELGQAFRKADRPIVHIVRLYLSDGSNVDLCRRADVERGARFLAPGALDTELAPGLLPPAVSLNSELLLAGGVQEVGAAEVIIYKPRWGAFFRTPLESHLRAADLDTLVFCGANFPNCPRTSMYEASERDFRIVAVTDAVSGLYERGASELAGIGVRLMTAAHVVGQLEAAHSVRTT